MTDEEILALNKAGLVPGPKESLPHFLLRAQETQEKFQKGDWLPPAHWDWVKEYLGQLFDVKPLYICAFYSNRSLAPWQAAATWIDERSHHLIQLRCSLKKRSLLSWLYSREEILSHEAVHAIRSGFQEDLFEEYFAYMTSEKKWRRVLGPIIQRPFEVWPLLIFLGAGIYFPLGFLGAALWSLMGFRRMILRHTQLRKAADGIAKTVKDPLKVRAILFRLTDEEIIQFSKGEEIQLYAEKQDELRWKLIRLAYLNEESVLWRKK